MCPICTHTHTHIHTHHINQQLKKKSKNKPVLELVTLPPQNNSTHCEISLRVHQQINKKKKWFIYTIEIHSATKKKVLTSFAGKLNDLEITIRREISQTQKDTCQLSPSIIEPRYHVDAQNHLHIIFLSSPSMLPYLMLSLIFRLVPSSSQNDCTASDAVVTRLSGRGDAFALLLRYAHLCKLRQNSTKTPSFSHYPALIVILTQPVLHQF